LLRPLYEAIYPPHAPRLGQSQRAKDGSNEVYWIDLETLDWSEPQSEPLEKAQRLEGNAWQIAEGRRRYEEWRAMHTASVEAASIPTHHVSRATEAGQVTEAESVPVEVVSVEALAVRPAGRRFGRLLHAVLQSGGASAEVHGRRFDATPEEVRAADAAARVVLAHPLLSAPAQRVFREYPVLVRLENGRLIEGRADLVRDEGATWTVVDYKTDMADKARYRRQLQLYAYALSRATGKPARGVLLEI
jgi:ATP-dependent exoDNAse (exonuclease V) beta subunit